MSMQGAGSLPGQLPVPGNLLRFPELHPALDSQSALAEANRCLYCFDAPCTAACPTHIDVPRFIKKIATGNLRGSALTILDANILGLSCSRVCPVDVLCEGSCVMHRYNKKPIEIGRLQRFAMDRFYDNGARLAANGSVRTGTENGRAIARGVACVGGGPASLACAAELRRQGVAVTVFDNRPLAGGLNTYGVAEYKLRPSDSLLEVELVRSMGVEFRQAEVGAAGSTGAPAPGGPSPGAPFNSALSLDELEEEFDFVFIGAGLGAMQRLGIPGEQLPGVIDALRFIERYKTEEDSQTGRAVIVIGAGNTAIDAANAAVRLGAREVHLVYRRTEKEMPAFPFEYEHSKVEGVRFHWLAQPMAVMEKNGWVAGVRFVQTRLGEPDATGRRNAAAIPHSEFEIACDLVVPALGQSRLTALLGLLERTRGVALRGGSIVVDRPTGRTSNPRYYAGGDCVNGGREVVDAVADGKRAAQAIVRAMAAAIEEETHG